LHENMHIHAIKKKKSVFDYFFLFQLNKYNAYIIHISTYFCSDHYCWHNASSK